MLSILHHQSKMMQAFSSMLKLNPVRWTLCLVALLSFTILFCMANSTVPCQVVSLRRQTDHNRSNYADWNDQNYLSLNASKNQYLVNSDILFQEFLDICRLESITIGILIDTDILQCLATISRCDKDRKRIYYAIFREQLKDILYVHKDLFSRHRWTISMIMSTAIEVKKRDVRIIFRVIERMHNFWILCPYGSFGESAVLPFSLQPIYINGAATLIPTNITRLVTALMRSKLIRCVNRSARHNNTNFAISDADFNEFVYAIHFLYSLDIYPMLFDGTALGWYRQCDLIPDTTDLDVAIPISQYSVSLKRHLLEQSRLQFHSIFGKPTDSLEYSLYVGDTKLDIFFMYEEENVSWIGGMVVPERRKLRWVFPLLAGICTAILREHLFYVPCNVQAFVEAGYGPNWQTHVPSSNFSYKLSHANLQQAGNWSQTEMAGVCTIFEYYQSPVPSYLRFLVFCIALYLGRKMRLLKLVKQVHEALRHKR